MRDKHQMMADKINVQIIGMASGIISHLNNTAKGILM
jgi:hypothetical protein